MGTGPLEAVDLLIEHGTVITMDPARRVLDDAAVAVRGDRIVAVGSTSELRQRYAPVRSINAHRKAVLPGLIDSHAHAGHGMLRTMGAGSADAWMDACGVIYTAASDEHFWRAESAMASLERLKAGVTTGVSLFGGGDSVMRVDDPKYARAHCDAVEKTGTRSVVAVGPTRPGGPSRYTDFGSSPPRESEVDAATMLAVCNSIIDQNHGRADGRLQVAVTLPVFAPMHKADHVALEGHYRQQAADYFPLVAQRGLTFTQDGHQTGTLALAHKALGLLGPRSFMSHSIDLNAEDIALTRDTDTRIVHNPSAVMSIRGRCPVPELIDAGVTVAIGSDGSAPDRGYDMFRHMFQCMHYHRRHFRDAGVLPHGKVLEMVTIDAARALSMEHEIGSLEVGKKADIILVDLFKPHMMPLNMPVYRVTCFANAADVTTTIVNGRVLMHDGEVLTVNQSEVLEEAQIACDRMLDRSGLRHLTDAPARLWGASHY
ncbi:MAG: amidohydrolase family protein [Rhodoferax sp.]|nr:amidohydrolase family protein [Rhodoferax sp.]